MVAGLASTTISRTKLSHECSLLVLQRLPQRMELLETVGPIVIEE